MLIHDEPDLNSDTNAFVIVSPRTIVQSITAKSISIDYLLKTTSLDAIDVVIQSTHHLLLRDFLAPSAIQKGFNGPILADFMDIGEKKIIF